MKRALCAAALAAVLSIVGCGDGGGGDDAGGTTDGGSRPGDGGRDGGRGDGGPDDGGGDAGDDGDGGGDADGGGGDVDGGPIAACGDGAIDDGEICDDDNTDAGDGCSADCALEEGFECTGAPSVCTSECGDGIVASDEGCDDAGIVAGDGCSDTCAVEAGWSCDDASPSMCMTGCGDGLVAGSEACDDGALVDGDGCSMTCDEEPGFTCTGAPSTCDSTCGDGALASTEACDDGNTADTDGCTAACAIEIGFVCTGSPSTCAPVCGDGVAAGAEACDDGNASNGDGCSAICSPETGFVCTGAPSTCVTTCGDGVAAGIEACDDGNTSTGDGCSGTCTTETGFSCTGTPSVCAPICGDGITTGVETCDDGNTSSGDCCSATCVFEVTVGALTCETEPNGTTGTADVLVAGTSGLLGAITPITDRDYFSFTLTAVSDVAIENNTGSSTVTCVGGDPEIRLYDATGIELASDDDDGVGICSLLTPATDAATRRLPAGTYYVSTEEHLNDAMLAQYNTRVSVLSRCGDGAVASTETCDDGNAAAGDGCSSVCQPESGYFCTGTPSVCRIPERNCSDGLDDDMDGLIDAADSDCAVPAYYTPCGAGQRLVIIRSSEVPRAIPDSGTVSSSVVVPAIGVVTRTSILFSATHTFDGDLDVSIVSPASTTYDLTSDNGGTGENYTSTLFSSACVAPVTAGTAPFSGCYLPEANLGPLAGTSPVGTWTLRVADDASGDTGTLESWSLLFCVTP